VESTTPGSASIDYLRALGAEDVHIVAVVAGVAVRVDVATRTRRSPGSARVEAAEVFDAETAAAVAAARAPVTRVVLSAERARVEARAQNARIRSWAQGLGVDVPERGRIPVPVQHAYARAHPEEPRLVVAREGEAERGTDVAQVLVRRLPVSVKSALRRRAARHGRSIEAEAREILQTVLTEAAGPSEDPDGRRAG
jgi:hypothetical protein